MKKIKVVFFIGSLRMGGAENVAVKLCDIFVEHLGWDLILLTGDNLTNDFYKGEFAKRVSLNFDYETKSKFKEQVSRIFKLRYFVTEYKPDLIIASSTDSSLRAIISTLFIGVPLIICEHSNYHLLKSKPKKILRNILYPLANKIFLLTDRDLSNYPERIRKKSVVMINPLGLSPKPIKRIFSKKLLAVGRLCWEKGFDRAIEIMLKLDDSYSLTIVGDGDLKAYLISLSEELGVSDKVFFAGSTKNIQLFYEQADMLLVCSRCEGLPMVIPEANAYGVPVISYDCETGPRELIEDGNNGFLVKEGDTSEMVRKIKLLANDMSLYEEMSEKSYQKALCYTPKNIATLWKNEVIKLLKVESP